MITNETILSQRRLGKAPARSHPKMLQLADFIKAGVEPPRVTNFWKGKAPFPLRAFGNLNLGNCTRAKQAVAALRMERIEQRRTIDITDAEVIRVYKEMTTRLYGADWVHDADNADTGAYEMDALNCWRREEETFKDTKGRPLTIDAYTRVNQASITEVKKAMWLSQAHGIAVCMNLPAAFFSPTVWDIPEGVQPIGEYLPGSWGGHSMYAVDYDEFGVTIPTWDIVVKVSWRAFVTYADEAYMVVDSLDAWRKKKEVVKAIDLTELKNAVNSVSSVQIS